MVIKDVQFVRSVIGSEDPIFNDGIPQVAFIGRSNVGKSSVINSLCGRKIAISSSTPGRTQQLNFFLVDSKIHFVDLPGYGYAKIGIKRSEKLRRLILWYLESSTARPQLVVLIIDALVGPKKFDLEMLEILKEQGYKVVIVANKADKIKNSQMYKQKKKLEEVLKGYDSVYYSAKTGKGREELIGKMPL